MCKGPVMGGHVAYLENQKKTSSWSTECKGDHDEDEFGKFNRIQMMQSSPGHVKNVYLLS